MRLRLAIALAVFLCLDTCGALAARATQQPGQADAPAGQQPQQAPPPSQPCAESKDTCELTEPLPQAPASAAPSQNQPQAEPHPKSEERKRRKAHRKRSQTAVVTGDPSNPKKTVIRNGGTSDPAAVLTPGVSTRSKYSPQMTANLLSATDANLKEAASRPLDASQTAAVDQIKVFMEKANAAVKAGDLDRGYNLALKAHLLSDDLVKH